MYTIDFETKKAVNGSNFSPMPVGVSIKHNNEPSKYYAWAHPTKNNSTYVEARIMLAKAIVYDEPILCHNAKFDLRVGLEHFGLAIPEPTRIHDTMIMAYLLDAREVSLGLKDLAYKYCGMPPDAQTDLKNWLIANVHGATESNFGEYISEAPGDLVGKYAESDTDMTYALFHTLASQVLDVPRPPNGQSIADAYAREQRVLPIVIDLERRGICISENVHATREKLEDKFDLLDLQLSAYSGGEKPGSKAMFNALRKKGLIDESKIQYTAKGNARYGKEFLAGMIKDKALLEILSLRSKLQKFIGTYLRPFSESAKLYDGKFYPYYNQTRSEDDYGTRTGRFSSNIQQLPKDSGTNFTLYAEDDFTIAEMPSVRSLITTSDPSWSIIRRDFSGQELRVTAHYAEGSILAAYQKDPMMDVHDFVDKLIQEKTGHHLSRTPVKMINFLKLYGGGPNKLAERLGIPLSQAQMFFQAYDTALPEFKGLMEDIEQLARSGKKIRTWGGRSYDVEESKDGREFYYKLGNVLIQGSSADMTKEAMCRYFYHPDRKGNLIMQVHDELICEVPDEYLDQEMQLLRWAMDEIPGWDVPLRSDGKFGKNLGQMTEYNDEQ
jgi:DNA polymerase-1